MHCGLLVGFQSEILERLVIIVAIVEVIASTADEEKSGDLRRLYKHGVEALTQTEVCRPTWKDI